MRSAGSGLALAFLLAACAAPPPAEPPPRGPVPADGSITVQVSPLVLDPERPAGTSLGQLQFAGGVAVTSTETSRLHGLSGLDIAADGRGFIAVSDDGDLLRGRLVLDAAGRLSGVEAVRLTPLKGETGAPLQGKAEGDAEALTWLEGGGFAVAFERNHRIMAYAAPEGPGRVLFQASRSQPGFRLSQNAGVEALASNDGGLFAGTEAGDIRGVEGGKLTAPAWAPEPPAGYSLTGLDALDGGDWIAVYRAWDPIRGARAVIAHLPQARCIRAPCTPPHGLIELARLERPLTVDNFEAIAAVRLPDDRGWRLYVLSDDNFSANQRTLLLAFDWRP